jgi:hypothetical protein
MNRITMKNNSVLLVNSNKESMHVYCDNDGKLIIQIKAKKSMDHEKAIIKQRYKNFGIKQKEGKK